MKIRNNTSNNIKINLFGQDFPLPGNAIVDFDDLVLSGITKNIKRGFVEVIKDEQAGASGINTDLSKKISELAKKNNELQKEIEGLKKIVDELKTVQNEKKAAKKSSKKSKGSENAE